MSGPASALAALRDALGDAHVLADPAHVEAAEACTIPTHQRVHGIVRPGNVGEVQAAVRIASQYGVPLYAVSRGRNWGYGSRVPHRDGSVLLDLGRLDRIREYREDLAYVRLEPGVTTGQLRDFLRDQRSRLWIPQTAAGTAVSSLGNLLDRGFATASSGPNENRVANACGFEVVLPNGELVVTGLGRYRNAAAAHVDNWAFGPQLDGLFAQSNLGIVTAATIWLAPRPPHVELGIGAVEDSALPEVVERLRELRLAATPRARFILSSRYRMAATRGQFPWHKTTTTPLPIDVLETMTSGLVGLPHLSVGGDWTLQVYLTGASRAQLAAERSLVKRALDGAVRRLVFVDYGKLEAFGAAGGRLARLRDRVLPLRTKSGDPSAVPNQLYWRKRQKWPSDYDPDRDRCGLLWWVPMMPWLGNKARAMTQLTERVVRAHGFEPNMSLRFPTDRSALIICAIAWDRDVAGEDERAMQCYEELVRVAAADEGCYPYRLGLQGMDILPPPDDATSALLRSLKKALDPADVVSPGRYDMRHCWPQGEG